MGIESSEVEVTQIDKHGIWLLFGEKESFLSFENFPRFRDASVGTIHNVELLNNNHLYWPDLDIDLAVESIRPRDKYPLDPDNVAGALEVLRWLLPRSLHAPGEVTPG